MILFNPHSRVPLAQDGSNSSSAQRGSEFRAAHNKRERGRQLDLLLKYVCHTLKNSAAKISLTLPDRYEPCGILTTRISALSRAASKEEAKSAAKDLLVHINEMELDLRESAAIPREDKPLLESNFLASRLEIRNLIYALEGRKRQAHLSPVLFPNLVSNVSALFRSGEFTYDIPADLTLKADRMDLFVLLTNLFLNAERACQKREDGTTPRITVRAAIEDGNQFAKISVSDNGAGLKREEAEQVFKRFFTTKEGPERSTSGIGLRHCRDIITRHGGTISFESTEGQGATVTFTIPVSRQLALF